MVLGQIGYDEGLGGLLVALDDEYLPVRQAAGSSIKTLAPNNLKVIGEFTTVMRVRGQSRRPNPLACKAY